MSYKIHTEIHTYLDLKRHDIIAFLPRIPTTGMEDIWYQQDECLAYTAFRYLRNMFHCPADLQIS